MKLLFDQNLSPYLVDCLADLYPGSAHVQSLSLDKVPDSVIWEYARGADFIILSKDEDFSELAALRGFPPKLIWLQFGNCATRQIEQALRVHHGEIEDFVIDTNFGTLVLR